MREKDGKGNREPNGFTFLLGILVILLAFVCWMNFGPLLSFRILSIKALREDPWAGVGDYLVVHAPYILFFIALYLGSNFILKTRVRELISGRRRYRWAYSFAVAGIYLGFLAIISLFQARTISLDQTPFIDKMKLLLPILLLTPMQALSEEIFFRALPARLIYHNELPRTMLASLPIILVSGFLFLVPHLGNPEVSSSFIFSSLYYFLWGALAMALGIYTDGFEAPVAMHIANNLYIALIVNYSDSSMPTYAIFINRGGVSSFFTVVEACIVFLLVFLFSYLMKKKSAKMLKG